MDDSDFTTRDDARAALQVLVDAIDAEVEVTDPPAALLRTLNALRAAAVRDVQLRGERLLQRATVQTRAEEPALVLAHRLYQDADRAAELAARNGVRHPAFVAAQTLEVLR